MNTNIILRAISNKDKPIIKCPKGCYITKTETPESFRTYIENKLNTEGFHYAQVLDDNNKFLCYDDINGAYIGNVSTDRNNMIEIYTKEHLDKFITNNASSLPEDLEYTLCNPYRKLNETFTVEIEIVEENNNASEEPISEEPISEEPISEEPISEEPISEEPISEEP